jgi:hypothetical protein
VVRIILRTLGVLGDHGANLRTANEAGDMVLSGAVCTANIAGVADGAWALIAPFGEHPSPDGSYIQRFDRQQGEEVVKTWNSITGRAARIFKNLWHGLGKDSSLPVWDGHPETDKQRWPLAKLLAQITDIRTSNEGLEGKLTWNAKGMERRSRGPLFPSPLWWHWPPVGTPAVVFPELLESVGLVATPNISSVPAWTRNATLASSEASQTQNENTMTEQQLNELRKALGLPMTADPGSCISAALAAQSTANSHAILKTANATLADEKADAEKKLREGTLALNTANGLVETVTTERDNLKTANAALTTERETLLTGILNLAEKQGAITPAEKESYKAKLTTANTAEATAAELLTRKAMNTEPVKINGNRVDISTSNARQNALQSAVSKRMKDDNSDYDTAFAAVKADPEYAALFEAMKQTAAS